MRAKRRSGPINRKRRPEPGSGAPEEPLLNQQPRTSGGGAVAAGRSYSSCHIARKPRRYCAMRAETIPPALRSPESGFTGKPQARPAKILPLTPYRNAAGTVLAFFDGELPSGLIVGDLRVMRGPGGKRWIAAPSVKRRDKDDRLVLGEDGKPIYDPTIEFRDKSVRDRFTEMFIEVLRRSHPELFDEDDGS
jgi:hypothetical protein